MQKYLLVTFVLFFGCNALNNDSVENEWVSEKEIITIPVVVHVINYAPQPFTISDEKIQSQIWALNRDFRRKNSDWHQTPQEFIDLVADVGIEFTLAIIDPQGNTTNGIIRTSSNLTGSDGNSAGQQVPVEDLPLYFSEKGGQDAWPNNKYLNIWIVDISNRHGNLGLAGYANPPGSDPRMDGVVIDPRAFGILPPLDPRYNLGRTATHEIGHWLGLRHIYGTDGICDDGDMHGDLVSDTPVQKSANEGNPTHPVSSCGSTNMFMNFMDRVNDKSMYMFTQGQKQKIRAIFNEGGFRRDLYINNR